MQGPAEAHLAGQGMGGEGITRSSFTPGFPDADDTDSSSSAFAGSDVQLRSRGLGRLSAVVAGGRRLLLIPVGASGRGASSSEELRRRALKLAQEKPIRHGTVLPTARGPTPAVGWIQVGRSPSMALFSSPSGSPPRFG